MARSSKAAGDAAGFAAPGAGVTAPGAAGWAGPAGEASALGAGSADRAASAGLAGATVGAPTCRGAQARRIRPQAASANSTPDRELPVAMIPPTFSKVSRVDPTP